MTLVPPWRAHSRTVSKSLCVLPVGFRDRMKLGVPSMLKYELPACRVRTGMGVDAGVTVGEGVMTA